MTVQYVVEYPNDSDASSSSYSPRAVVLILGWMGAQPRHLRKYAQLYHQRNCVTVSGTAPPGWAVMTKYDPLLEKQIRNAVTQVFYLLKKHDVPVLVHAFSNGGAFLMERLEVLIERAKNSPLLSDQQQLVLLSEHWRGQILDSAPSFLSPEAGYNGIRYAFAKIPIVMYIVLSVHWILNAWLRFRTDILGKKDKRLEWWKHMTGHCSCTIQGYVYSSADNVASAAKLDELVARRKALGARVLVRKFADTSHCMHLIKHREEYCTLLDEMLNLIIAKNNKAKL